MKNAKTIRGAGPSEYPIDLSSAGTRRLGFHVNISSPSGQVFNIQSRACCFFQNGECHKEVAFGSLKVIYSLGITVYY